MGEVARFLLDKPNRAMSTGKNVRYGERGSLSVDIVKGTWFDFETNTGGGVLDLIERETGPRGDDRFAWLREHEFKPNGSGKSSKPSSSNGSKAHEKPKKRIRGDRHPSLGDPVATYPYTDANGVLLFEVARFDPKDFRPRQPDGDGNWYWDLQGLDDKLVVYRLPETNEAVALGRRIDFFEGEKDADAGVAIGLNATCCRAALAAGAINTKRRSAAQT